MELWNNILPVIFFLGASVSGCAAPFQQIELTPPKAAHLYITAEIQVSDVCVKVKSEDGKKETSKCFDTRGRKALGSGIHIKKYRNPRTGMDSSLVLTAQHLCNIIPEDKRDLLSLFYDTRGWDKNLWDIADKNITLTSNPTIKWRYLVYDHNGIKYNVNPKTVALSNSIHDMCLLESERISEEPIQFAAKSPIYGARIINVSNPDAGRYLRGESPAFSLITEGFLVNNDQKLGILAVSDLNVTFGSSGSLLAVRRGNRWELVGMVFAIKTTPYHPFPPLYTIATSIETINQFVNSEFKLYLKREARIARESIKVTTP